MSTGVMTTGRVGPTTRTSLPEGLIKITRPHLLPDYETTYWVKLQ